VSDDFDLLIANGTVVTSRTMVAADVAIRGESIAAIGEPGRLRAPTVLNAEGRYVLPGVIDAHVHFREPGLEYKEDFGTGTRAAVMGGVTTVLDMPNSLPPTSTPARVHHKRALAEARAYCDVGFYGLLAQDNVGELAGMAEAGVVGFKCFLGQSTGNIPAPDDGRLLEALGIVARLDMRCGFHAENDAILQHLVGGLQAEGRTDALAHLESRPEVAEVEAIQRAALFAATTGARIHVFHLSTAGGLAMVEAWRRQGVDITCEVTPHHCFLSADAMRALGSLVRINPPVREAGHAARLLDALAAGSIDCIATDHAPHLASEKLNANIWQAASGFGGVELSLRLFLTLGVNAGRLSLPDLVRATSERPARTWGLAPRKGSLEVGADADVTIVDLDFQDVIEASRLHGKNNLTPFEGLLTRGGAVATIVRGQVVMQAGELVGEPRGRMVRRQTRMSPAAPYRPRGSPTSSPATE
jgi:allantoinase